MGTKLFSGELKARDLPPGSLEIVTLTSNGLIYMRLLSDCTLR